MPLQVGVAAGRAAVYYIEYTVHIIPHNLLDVKGKVYIHTNSKIKFSNAPNEVLVLMANCYAKGNVQGNDETGGFIGYNDSQAITNAFSSGLDLGRNIEKGLQARYSQPFSFSRKTDDRLLWSRSWRRTIKRRRGHKPLHQYVLIKLIHTPIPVEVGARGIAG